MAACEIVCGVMCFSQERAADLHREGRGPNTLDDGRDEHTEPVKNMNLSHCMTFSPQDTTSLSVSFTTDLKSNLPTSLTTKNTTDNNCIISHAQNTTAF